PPRDLRSFPTRRSSDLLRRGGDRAGLLDLYGRVWAGKQVAAEETNPLVDVLRLSGITRAITGGLAVRNRIYERVFDREWITQHRSEEHTSELQSRFDLV